MTQVSAKLVLRQLLIAIMPHAYQTPLVHMLCVCAGLCHKSVIMCCLKFHHVLVCVVLRSSLHNNSHGDNIALS